MSAFPVIIASTATATVSVPPVDGSPRSSSAPIKSRDFGGDLLVGAADPFYRTPRGDLGRRCISDEPHPLWCETVEFVGKQAGCALVAEQQRSLEPDRKERGERDPVHIGRVDDDDVDRAVEHRFRGGYCGGMRVARWQAFDRRRPVGGGERGEHGRGRTWTGIACRGGRFGTHGGRRTGWSRVVARRPR